MKKYLQLIFVITIIILGYFLGKKNSAKSPEIEFSQLLPEARKIVKSGENLYFAYNSANVNACPSGFIVISQCKGYAGPIRLAVAYGMEGNIKNIKILDHSETPSFFEKVIGSGFVGKFSDRHYSTQNSSDNVETITGATLTSDGIVGAVNRANQNLSKNVFDENNRPVCYNGLRVGAKEIVLMVLFLLSGVLYYAPLRRTRKTNLRLILQLVALLLLGIIFTEMLSITHFNTLLMGYFPANQLFWYLLLALFGIPILILGINPYFFNICPFGNLQDLLARIPAKKYNPSMTKAGKLLRVLPGILTLGIIFYALLNRKPGFFGHEIFSTVFQLQGSIYLFFVAGFVMIVAIFVRRPWCRYLCPVGTVGRFLVLIRSIFRKK